MASITAIQGWLFLALAIALFLAAVVAFIECLRYPDENYRATDKRSKRFWALILGACLLVTFLGLPLPQSFMPLFITLLALVGVLVFWLDVRPAIRSVDRRLRRKDRP